MPEGAEALMRQHPEFEAAKAAVAAWLERLGAAPLAPAPRPLSFVERYTGRKGAFGVAACLLKLTKKSVASTCCCRKGFRGNPCELLWSIPLHS